MSAGISCAVRLMQGHVTKEADLDDENRSGRRIFISDEWVDGWCKATDDADQRTAWRFSQSGRVCPRLYLRSLMTLLYYHAKKDVNRKHERE